MKEKWTPGPWEVERWTDRFAIVADGGEHEDDAVICERRASATSKVALAEMHLMAAAPDLYEALRNLRKLNADAAASGYTDHAALHALYEGNAVASAALSKADGDSQ